MHDAWDEIERLGRELGAGAEAMRKWRVRGVPAKWQLQIMAADTSLDRSAFANPPGSKRADPTPSEPPVQTEAA